MSPLSLPSLYDGGQSYSWTTTTDEPYYTDDDLVILHDIVVRAQHILPTLPPKDRLPTLALAKAYYEFLPDLGIHPDHDSRYFRFIFKIGATGEFTGTLFDKFEECLAKRGITLEFDYNTHDYLRSNKATSQDVADNKESDTLYNDENDSPLPRRNSETGVLDLEIAAQAQAPPQEPKHKRNKSVSPLPLGPTTPAKLNELKSFISEATRAPSPEPIPEPTPQPPRTTQKGREERGLNNVRNWLEASEDGSPRSQSRSISAHGSIRSINRDPERVAPRDRPSGRIPIKNITYEDQDINDELTTPSEAEEHEAQKAEEQEVEEQKVEELESDDEDDEEQFYDSFEELEEEENDEEFYDSSEVFDLNDPWVRHVIKQNKRAKIIRTHDLLIRKLLSWRDQARERLDQKAKLNAIAMKHDNGALKEQALSGWVEKARAKKIQRLLLEAQAQQRRRLQEEQEEQQRLQEEQGKQQPAHQAQLEAEKAEPKAIPMKNNNNTLKEQALSGWLEKIRAKKAEKSLLEAQAQQQQRFHEEQEEQQRLQEEQEEQQRLQEEQEKQQLAHQAQLEAKKAEPKAVSMKSNNNALKEQALSGWLEKIRAKKAEKLLLEAQAQQKQRLDEQERQELAYQAQLEAEQKLHEQRIHEAQQAKLYKAQKDAEKARQAELEAERAELEFEQKFRAKGKKFARIGLRAVSCRNDHLKKKAFTHWLAIAQDKVEATKAAERQMMRSRTFKAWKSHTKETEEKVQLGEEKARQVQLKKFLEKWKAKKLKIDVDAEEAAEVDKCNMLERVFSKMAEKKKVKDFTKEVEQKNKQRALSTWVEKAQAVAEATQLADDENLLKAVEKTMKTWKQKTVKQVALNQEAEMIAETKKKADSMYKWHREAQTAPARRRVQGGHNAGVLKGALHSWKKRAEKEKQAAEIDRAKILREAFTKWRHQTRAKISQAISEGRAVAKAFKIWELKTKLKGAEAQREEDVKFACLEVWFDRAQDTRSRRWEREETARRYDNTNLATSVLKCWYARMDEKAEFEAQAAELQAPRILGECFDSMREKVKKIAIDNKTACGCRKFFLMRTALYAWRDATFKAKREKRKQAYIKVRRNRKYAIGRRWLSVWRAKAQEKMALSEQANQFAQGKTYIIGMDKFDQWRARTDEVAEYEPLWKEMVMRKFFNRWKNRTESLQVLNIEATLDHQEHNQSEALRKWRLKAIQAKAMANTAKEVHDRSTRKGQRKMLHHWQKRTANQRPIVEDGTPPGTETAENWSDFGEEVEMDEITRRLYEKRPAVEKRPVVFNPITPGYMATPSRRRVAASVRYQSTSARGTLQTPELLRSGVGSASLGASGNDHAGMTKGGIF
ncbi:WD repeat protein [Botrytis cinerea]